MIEITIGKNWSGVDVDGKTMAHFYDQGIAGRGEHNAKLWAHGYPALLEAVQRYFRSDERRRTHWNNCRRYVNSSSPCTCGLDALSDAMKACEPLAPPKKTREEALKKLLDDYYTLDLSRDYVALEITALFAKPEAGQ